MGPMMMPFPFAGGTGGAGGARGSGGAGGAGRSSGSPSPPVMPFPFAEPIEQPAEPKWVLGGVFMEQFVTVFDFDTQKVGFGETRSSLPKAVIQDYRVNDVLPNEGGTVQPVLPKQFANVAAQSAGAATPRPAAKPEVHNDAGVKPV